MQGQTGGYQSVDEYIAAFPDDVQAQLRAIRAIIRGAAPEAQERISYAMPAFTLDGNLVYYAALKRHIGLYPMPSGITAFASETARYVSTKGALRFPLDQELPADLIARIVRYRVAENQERAAAKIGAKVGAKARAQ